VLCCSTVPTDFRAAPERTLGPAALVRDAPCEVNAADGGSAWRQGGDTLSTTPAHSIVADSGNPRLAYAGTVEGVYRTTDGGQTWSDWSGDALGTGADVTSLALDMIQTAPTDSAAPGCCGAHFFARTGHTTSAAPSWPSGAATAAWTRLATRAHRAVHRERRPRPVHRYRFWLRQQHPLGRSGSHERPCRWRRCATLGVVDNGVGVPRLPHAILIRPRQDKAAPRQPDQPHVHRRRGTPGA